MILHINRIWVEWDPSVIPHQNDRAVQVRLDLLLQFTVIFGVNLIDVDGTIRSMCPHSIPYGVRGECEKCRDDDTQHLECGSCDYVEVIR